MGLSDTDRQTGDGKPSGHNSNIRKTEHEKAEKYQGAQGDVEGYSNIISVVIGALRPVASILGL